MIDLYNECSKFLPPVLMQASQSVQTLVKAVGQLKKHPPPMKTQISLNQLNNFARNFQ